MRAQLDRMHPPGTLVARQVGGLQGAWKHQVDTKAPYLTMQMNSAMRRWPVWRQLLPQPWTDAESRRAIVAAPALAVVVAGLWYLMLPVVATILYMVFEAAFYFSLPIAFFAFVNYRAGAARPRA